MNKREGCAVFQYSQVHLSPFQMPRRAVSQTLVSLVCVFSVWSTGPIMEAKKYHCLLSNGNHSTINEPGIQVYQPRMFGSYFFPVLHLGGGYAN